MSNSLFTGNEAEESPPSGSEGNGGAIDNGDESGQLRDPDRVGLDLQPNTAALGGGAIDSADGGGSGTAQVSSSTFTSNTAIDGGGIDSADNAGIGDAHRTASTFANNTATIDGGGINSVDRGGSLGSGTAVVSTSTFYANSAIDGGAIDNGSDASSNAALTATATTFDANTAASLIGPPSTTPTAAAATDTVYVAADIFDGTCARRVPGHGRGLQRRDRRQCQNGGTGDLTSP